MAEEEVAALAVDHGRDMCEAGFACCGASRAEFPWTIDRTKMSGTMGHKVSYVHDEAQRKRRYLIEHGIYAVFLMSISDARQAW